VITSHTRANCDGDGRAAYFSLHNHYLGPNSVDSQAAAAEKTLLDAAYYGKPRFSFKTYVTIHKKQHDILENLKRYGYSGIDEGTKVRYLNNGIKAQSLQPAILALKANAQYRQDFDKCVAYYKEALKAHSKAARELNVSQFSGQGRQGGGGRGGRGGRSGRGRGQVDSHKRKSDKGYNDATQEEDVEMRYYNSKEYAELKPGQKKKLARLRSERDTRQVAQISQLTAQVQSLQEQAAMVVASNRTNPNLQRQG